MPIGDRDYIRGKHPPNCTCTECTDKRLGKLRREAHSSYISICPRCGQKSLWHNVKEHKYECLNVKCKAAGSHPDEIAKKPEPSGVYEKYTESDEVKHYSNSVDSGKVSDRKSGSKTTSRRVIQNWLIALLLIFALFIIGLGVSIFVGSFIPVWILLGFSLFYSVEKWFYYLTKKYKALGKLYRFLLNLSILALLGLIIWTGIQLFSQQFLHGPLIGSLVFLAEFVFFVWMWRIVSKNSWRWPSMKLTVFSLLCLFIIFAFAGVRPLASYKDVVISKITNFIDEQELKAEERRIGEENRRAIEKAEMDAAGVVSEYAFYKDYVVFFNEFRSENGRPPLIFDTALNKLAADRAIEISQPGNFSHEGINKYNFGENIAMMAYSSDSASDLIKQWASSPGHRNNMLLSSYHSTGFAKNGKYAVQIFD